MARLSSGSRRPGVKRRVTARLAAAAIGVSALACGPGHALASNNSDEDEHFDARVQGYDPTAEVKGASGALQWMMLISAAVVCVGVLFKDAKRTHLD